MMQQEICSFYLKLQSFGYCTYHFSMNILKKEQNVLRNSGLCNILHSVIAEKRGNFSNTVIETSYYAELSKNHDY